jgi:hypothetical protein
MGVKGDYQNAVDLPLACHVLPVQGEPRDERQVRQDRLGEHLVLKLILFHGGVRKHIEDLTGRGDRVGNRRSSPFRLSQLSLDEVSIGVELA